MKKFLSAIVLVFLFTINATATPGTSIARSDPECTGNGGTLSLFGTTDCVFTPDLQKVTFYRLDLCNSKPSGPTTTLVTDRTNCSTFFKNDNGYEATITKNIINQIGTKDDFFALPFSNYKYGIIEIDSVLISKGSLYGAVEEGIAKQNLVITTQKGWDDLKAKMDKVNDVSSTFQRESVDFEKEQVIAVFDAVKSSGGYTVELKVSSNTENIVVDIEYISPDGITTMAITQPYHIVKIPISDFDTVFD